MNAERLNHFTQLHALGYRNIIPIIPPEAPTSPNSTLYARLQAGKDDRGKSPGMRGRDGLFRGLNWLPYQADEDDLQRWHEMGCGAGIKTGEDGLILIDADTLSEERAAIIKRTIESVIGELPVRVGRYPKAGYLCRVTKPIQYTRIEFGGNEDGTDKERVEVLSGGRQFVACGIHPVTMKAYQWPRGIPALADVPVVHPDKIAELLEQLRPLLPAASDIVREGATTEVSQESLRGDVDLIRRAVAAIPNTSEHFPTRESYRDLGYAVKAALPDDEAEAFEIFAEWCDRWEDGDNPRHLVEADWRRMKPPFRRGASWVYEMAERHSGGAFNANERWFEPVEDYAPLFPEISDDIFESPKRKLTLTSFDTAAATALEASAKPLIKGVLDQGAMSVLYAESNAGKTFVALDMAYHVARGLEWAGRRTAALPVLYVAAEGGGGARKRAAALAARYGAAGDAFQFLLAPINLLKPEADLRPLLETARAWQEETGQGFGLIVIDTLSRAMAGGDENASTDMGAMVKHLDVLRAATGAHLMAVHHSGKDRAKGARGHSLLRAATDTEIEIVDRRLGVTKQRDLDGSFETGFVLDVVTLGVDQDGDPVTSCTIRLVDADEAALPIEEEIDTDMREAALRLIEAQCVNRHGEALLSPWRKDHRAGDAWVGAPIGQAMAIDVSGKEGRDRVQTVIADWIRRGFLVEETRKDTARRLRVFINVGPDVRHDDAMTNEVEVYDERLTVFD